MKLACTMMVVLALTPPLGGATALGSGEKCLDKNGTSGGAEENRRPQHLDFQGVMNGGSLNAERAGFSDAALRPDPVCGNSRHSNVLRLCVKKALVRFCKIPVNPNATKPPQITNDKKTWRSNLFGRNLHRRVHMYCRSGSVPLDHLSIAF